MDSSAADWPPLPGVLGKLHAREAQRAAEAARRLETLQGSSDPGESIEGFMGAFAKQRQALEGSLQTLLAPAGPTAATGSAGDAAAAVEGLAADISALDREVAAAAYYLPLYDLRQATLAVAALKEQLEAARAALQPRKKFSFSRRAAAAAAGTPPPRPAAAGAGAAQTAGGGEAAVDEVAGSLQQLLISSGGDGASSGRIISGLRDQVVMEQRGSVEGLDFTLSDLEGCSILLLGPLAALFAHRLRNCRIYTGPVAGAVFLEDVSDSTLVLASRQVRIHATQATDVYLRVASNPIVEFSQGVRFAPYALPYPGAEQDLEDQGLGLENGKWADVHDFGWLRATKSPNWDVIPEEQRQPPPELPEQEPAS